MAKVVVAPAPDFDGIVVSKPIARVSWQSTKPRFDGLSDPEKNEARTFRALGQPRTRHALVSTFGACTLLMLLVSVPCAATERMADANPMLQKAMRGAIVGVLAYFALGPIFLGFAPTLVRGGFHPRFLLSMPLTLCPAVGAAFIPADGSTLGFVSIGLLSLGIGFILCSLLLNAPYFATDEHKALDRSFGPPLFAIAVLFFGLITAYVTLTQLYSSPLVGLLMPTGSAVIRTLAMFAMGHSFHKFYFEPKQAFLTELSLSEQSQADVEPPILGDVEDLYGYVAAGFALFIGNAPLVATIVEAMLAPDSTAWVLSLVVSFVLEVATRTGIQQRVELCIAAELAAKFDLQWSVRLAKMNALKLVYLHSLGSTGYVAPVMAVCIGCVRAVTFGDATAIVWLDASPTVWKVIIAQLASQIVGDVAVRAVKKTGLQKFELSARFAAGHPLSSTAFGDFGLQGYAVVFGMGGCFIYVVYIAFLGPEFVTGLCPAFAPNATQVWVWGASGCANVTASLVNASLEAGARP